MVTSLARRRHYSLRGQVDGSLGVRATSSHGFVPLPVDFNTYFVEHANIKKRQASLVSLFQCLVVAEIHGEDEHYSPTHRIRSFFLACFKFLVSSFGGRIKYGER